MGAVVGLLVALLLKIQKPFILGLSGTPPSPAMRETGHEQFPPPRPGPKCKEHLLPLATLGNLSRLVAT